MSTDKKCMSYGVLPVAIVAACVGLGALGGPALAQTNVPVANQPKQCQDLAKNGFVINSTTVTRSGTTGAPVATQPRAGSYGPSRKYGEGGNNKWFIDSFPASSKDGCRICGVWVTVKGTVNPNNQNNDSVSIVGAKSAAAQITGSPLHFNTVHTKLGGSTAALPSGPYSSGFMIEGPAYMNWWLSSP